jgi:uncharacterized membrane protein
MNLLDLLVAVVVIGLVFYLLWWLLGKIALPEPFNKVAMVILCLAAVVILISMLTGSLTFPVLHTR